LPAPGAPCGGSARKRRGDEAKARALQIEKLKVHDCQASAQQFGPILGAGRILEQLELQLSELQENASEAEAAAKLAAASENIKVQSFERRKPARRPLPEHLPRERIVYPSPAAAVLRRGFAPAGRGRDRDAGADPAPVESDPARAREFSCRSCETITQPPRLASDRAGTAGPGLLAHNSVRQVRPALAAQPPKTTYAREGIDLDVSTLATGGRSGRNAERSSCDPRLRIRRSRSASRRRDDVPVQAKGKLRTGRYGLTSATTSLRRHRPAGGGLLLLAGPRRQHPEEHLASYAGLMQADAYPGSPLYQASRRPGPIVEASCWAQRGASSSTWRGSTRRRSRSRRSSASMPCSRSSARSTARRRTSASRVRNERSRPLVLALETWLREQRRQAVPARNEVAKAIQYSSIAGPAHRFLEMAACACSNNAANGASWHRHRPA